MLEAAVSSAICHPNIVQTYDYQIVDTYQSANALRTEATRVRHANLVCSPRGVPLYHQLCEPY